MEFRAQVAGSQALAAIASSQGAPTRQSEYGEPTTVNQSAARFEAIVLLSRALLSAPTGGFSSPAAQTEPCVSGTFSQVNQPP